MLGYGPTELVFSPQSGTWESLLHPDDKERALRALGRCLGGETEEYDEEFRLRTKAGDWCWIESRARVAERDPAGNPLRLVGSHRDITERKKADDALHESEDRYRSLVSNVPGVIFTMDLEGKITFVSRRIEEMLGYEGSDVVNRSILDFIPEEERQKAMESLQKGVTGEGVKHFQTPVMRKSGERLLLECSFARVRKDGRVVGAQGTAVDITERKRAEEVLRESERSARQRAEELRVVGQVTTAITAGLGIEQLMQTVYEQCQLLFPIDTFYIVLYDAATDSVSFPFMQKDGERRLLPSRYLRAEPGLLEHVIRGRQTVYLPDAAHSPIPMVRQPGAVSQSIVAVPMILRDLVIGVLSMQSQSSDVYSLEQIQLFERLVSQVATAIQNSRLYETVSHGLEATLTALGRAAERRDPYTAGHQRRVTDLALAIACKLEYGKDACSTLRIAGMLHDIGKLSVPAEILSKPTALSKIELELIREHPKAAYEILADIAFPGPVAEIVLQHHERQDGSGYPKGILGDAILPEARILAVADVVEAMASHRPYRPALGIAAALDEIRAGRGTRYDQQVVDACVVLFESGEFSFQSAPAG
jgi:PAS domain S-box-containing protein